MNLVTKHKKTAEALVTKYREMGVTPAEFSGIMPLRDADGTLFVAQFHKNLLIGAIVIPNKDYMEFIRQLLKTEPQVKVDKIDRPS